MDENILRRIEAKLDIIIGLLQDGILTGDEVALLNEADEIVGGRGFQDLERL